eukprot:s691_g28.t1
MAQWEVIGGAGKGGILVRKGVELTSESLEERLSTGAVIQEISLNGDRLHFRANWCQNDGSSCLPVCC